MRRISVAPLLFAIVWSTSARAEDEKAAAAHFREGRRAFDAHDCVRAAIEFEVANRAKPAAAALLSAGIAWECNGDWIAAATDLEAALAVGGLEAPDEATARKHLADVDAKVARLEIVGPTGARASLDGKEEDRALPLHVRVEPGNHTIDTRFASGASEHRLIHVAAGESALVDVTPAPPTTVGPQASPFPMQRTFGWIAVGLGATVFVTGAIVGGVGMGDRDRFVAGGSTNASLHDEAVTMRTVANVLWVSAAVFAVTGVALVLTAPKGNTVTVAAHANGGSVRWTF